MNQEYRGRVKRHLEAGGDPKYVNVKRKAQARHSESAKSEALEKAKGGKKMVRVSVGKKPEEIGHTIEDHKGRVLKKYEPAKKDAATRRYEGGGTFYGR